MQNNKAEDSPSQALGLTIYDLPDPMASVQEDAKRTWGGRWRMILVLLVCAAPVIASYLTYYVIRPQTFRHFGELIQPVQPIPDIMAQSIDGKSLKLTQLKGQWLIVSVASGACDAMCQNNLLLQRQIRATLGREADRTDWVWLVNDNSEISPMLQAGLTDAVVLRVAADELSKWLVPQTGHGLNEHLYLIDPHGNWMMRFPAGLQKEQAPDLKRDWDRLLRASVHWDKAGR
jgi:hypothetical protein